MVGSRDLPPSTVPFYPRVFINNQFRTSLKLPPGSTNLSSKTALVTGANIGLGLEACHQLLDLKLGHLVLACRSTRRGEDAAKALRTKYPLAKIEVLQLDMSDYKSIQTFAQRCAQLPRLDISILNAGIMPVKRTVNPNTKHEDILQINYISTYLLATLLLPILKRHRSPGSPGRLTIVGAALALVAEFPPQIFDKNASIFAVLDDPKTWVAQSAYCVSKALGFMFLWKLVDFVSADDVVVNIADPAFVRGTNLQRDQPAVLTLVVKLFGAILGRSARMGTSCIIDAAVTQGKEGHGAFLMSYEIHPFTSMLYTPEGRALTERLWDETMDELAFADVRGILDAMRGPR